MSDFKQYTGFDGVSVSTARTFNFKDALKPIPVEVPSATANDVLRDIDQLRRDLSGYHGQLKAHNDMQRHCDNQRKRISELEGLYAKAKDENAKLRELCMNLYRVTWACDDSKCPYGVECGDDPDKFMPNCKFKDLMRELGVEVDE